PDLRHPFLSGQNALPVDPRVAAAAAERVVEPPDEFLVGARIADEGPRLEGSVGGHAAVGGDRSPPRGCWYRSARSGSTKSRRRTPRPRMLHQAVTRRCMPLPLSPSSRIRRTGLWSR